MARWLWIVLLWLLPAQAQSPVSLAIAAARRHLGDRYSAAYFQGGYPPKGQSACVDVVVSACRARGVDLREAVQRDANCGLYPWLRDRDIDHRWAPNLRVWMQRHAENCPKNRDFRPGDFIFWSLTGDGVADHCGVVSDQRGLSGKWRVIHQYPPLCQEEDCLGRWSVVGHFRLR